MQGVRKELVGLTNNWIITTSFGYDSTVLIPLVESIQRHSPKSHLLVLTDSSGLAELSSLKRHYPFLTIKSVEPAPKVIRGRFALARKILSRSQKLIRRILQQSRYGILVEKGGPPISIEDPRRLHLSTCQAHLLIRRFFWVKKLLRSESMQGVDYVLLTDARDVVLQSDPFQGCGERLITGEEGEAIGQSPMNHGWIAKAYGKPLADDLSQHQALCAGVLIGSRSQMEAYLDCFCASTLAIMRQQRTALLPNWDQGIHNKILRIDQPVELVCSAADGLISTLGCIKPERIAVDRDGRVVVDGKVPAVLHQYDRHPGLVTHLQQLLQP